MAFEAGGLPSIGGTPDRAQVVRASRVARYPHELTRELVAAPLSAYGQDTLNVRPAGGAPPDLEELAPGSYPSQARHSLGHVVQGAGERAAVARRGQAAARDEPRLRGARLLLQALPRLRDHAGRGRGGCALACTLAEWSVSDYVTTASPWISPERVRTVERLEFYQRMAWDRAPA